MKKFLIVMLFIMVVCLAGTANAQTIRVLLYEQIPSYVLMERLPEFEKATGINVEYELLAEAQMEKKEMPRSSFWNL